MSAQQNPLGLRLKAPEDLLRRDRLPTFKTRDLTLGGSNLSKAQGVTGTKNDANKKIFKPNLNVARTKSNDIQTSRNTATNRGKVKDKNDRVGRGSHTQGQKRNNLVQAQGVFSEGAAIAPAKRSSSSRAGGNVRESNTSEGLIRPLINKLEVKIDPEVESQHLKEILGDDEDNTLTDEVDKLMPISVEDYKRIKLEPNTEGEGLEDFMRKKDSGILLFQLPDILPGLPSVTKIEASVSKDEIKSSTSSEEYYTLRQVPEGQIGQLLKYKSGKMKLVLGENHFFEITHGLDQTFLQEVVSINTNKHERSGSIVNLGKVNGKLSVTPDWKKLLDGKS